ncbi:hypothetical protein [Alkalimonas amylolytica]|uniref:hypothetical protein n=1 Tax=Alkalimonas amylolytica TaxID=152573 RepID=UPI001114FABE|nr:hypothetical protein [Alkalimonas amylolytica]
MSQLKTSTIAILSGAASVAIGLVAFALSWNLWFFWGGPMPGIRVLLFPGNLSLVYLWHPLFTEEINFWPKLALQMLGQFSFVACAAAVVTRIVRRLRCAKAL